MLDEYLAALDNQLPLDVPDGTPVEWTGQLLAVQQYNRPCDVVLYSPGWRLPDQAPVVCANCE